MPEARVARADDLASLLILFRLSEVSAAAEPQERAERIWAEMLARDGLTVFLSEADSRIVATCTPMVLPFRLSGLVGSMPEPFLANSRAGVL